MSANGYWYDYVFMSNDDKLDNSDIYLTYAYSGYNTPLAPNSSYTINYQSISLPANAGLGDRYLLFVADYSNYLGETNEADNVVATPITLSAPDLVVSGATAPQSGLWP